MARLPQPGGDAGSWGNILNDFLAEAHKTDGTLKDNSVTASALAPGAVSNTTIQTNSVSGAKLQDATVSETKLDSALQTKVNTVGSIGDGTITPAKLSSDTPVSGELLSYNGSGFEWITAPAAGGGGEANTASNIGTGGVGVYKQKTGVNFELKKINAGSNKVTITDDTANNEIDIDVITANLGLTKSDVGLANVDNTSDANKPVSSATQTALNAKEATITAGTTAQYFRGDKSWQTLDKAAVGLANVDNTSDLDKPVSTAIQTAIDDLQASVDDVVLVGDPLSTFSGTINYQQAAPYTVFNVIYDTGTSTWPNRPSARTDLVFAWSGPAANPPTIGGTGMLSGVDKFWAEY